MRHHLTATVSGLLSLGLLFCGGFAATAKTAAPPIKTATATVVRIDGANDLILNVRGKLWPASGRPRLMIAGQPVTMRDFKPGATVRIRYWVAEYLTPPSENPLSAKSYYLILSMADADSSTAFFEQPTFGGRVRTIRPDASSLELDLDVTPAGPPLLPTSDFRVKRQSRFWLRGRRLSSAEGFKALQVGDYVHIAEEPRRPHHVYAVFDRESWRTFARHERAKQR